MRKIFLFSAAVMMTAVLFTACGGNGSSNASDASETPEVSNFIREEDNRPPIVLEGEGYQLELPAFAEDVQCEPISDEEEEELRSQGYAFVVKPLNVTRNGENHVQLGQPATVCFAIPEDYPKDKYDELVGVLITDDGPEYKIPDYYALRDGFIKFETSHFTITSAEQKKYELREKFIEEVAVNGWGRNMSNKDMEPTLREQINKFANDYCLGENDLVGIAMREVFGEKDFVKIGLDIVNAYDMENASLEERMAVASETMIKLAKGKVLSYFIKKLKTDETKKVKVLDEIKSEKKGEFVYKTELVNIDSRRNKVIGVLEDHFNMENAEKVGTVMGDNPTFEQCYIYACQYIGNFAKEKTKETLIEMIPYLGYLKQMATAVEIWKKFWAATQMQDLYREYEKKANAKGDLLDPDEWDRLTMYISAPEFLHGMTDKKMKEYIEQRYLEKMEIERRKEELREYIAMIEESVDLKSECFEQKHFDYVQRLTVVRNLMDRFYDELVGDDGYLTYIDNGYRQAICTPHEVNQQLCYVVDEYLKCYPNREKFYVWLDENGYDYGQLEDEYNRLDKLLWKEKEEYEYNPDIWIEIKETLGAGSGQSQYWGKTIALGTNGTPYKGWHAVVNSELVGDEEGEDNGWNFYVAFGNEPINLHQFKEIGMPNQVLIYSSENSFLHGGSPMETFEFEVDTLGETTTVELGKQIETIKEFVAVGGSIGYYYDMQYKDNKGKTHNGVGLPDAASYYAIENALSNVSPFFLSSNGGNISFTASGDGSDGDRTVHVDLTVNGNVVLEEYNKDVTATITANVVAGYGDGTKITARFNVSTEGVKKGLQGHGGFVCNAEGKVQVKIVYEDGGTVNRQQDGYIRITFEPAGR